MEERAAFSGPEVCVLAGVTYRQLDYWCRTDRLRPPGAARGSGTQRRFDLREAQIAWVLGRLSRLGVGLRCQTDSLRYAPSWTGWLVVHEVGCEHVTDPDLLALWPIAAVVDLAACPLQEEPCAATSAMSLSTS